MGFHWDSDKAQVNLDTHEIDFSDTGGVFEGQWALTIKEDYVDDEPRFATLGMDFLGRVLVVVYTYRHEDIRLISACHATRPERRTYERKRLQL